VSGEIEFLIPALNLESNSGIREFISTVTGTKRVNLWFTFELNRRCALQVKKSTGPVQLHLLRAVGRKKARKKLFENETLNYFIIRKFIFPLIF